VKYIQMEWLHQKSLEKFYLFCNIFINLT
jgi:hypothetical protein